MVYAIETEIERFKRLLKQAHGDYGVLTPLPYAGILTPRGYSAGSSKAIGLTLMGLTHGNEWAGAAVLNSVLECILARVITLRIPVAFILGNPEAARQNKRFLQRDLNRSFGRGQSRSGEEGRALELEGVLAHTAFLLDFHQTMQPSHRPFFIFPYRRDALALAHAIAPELTIVTHWGRSFSTEGLCTDEFVNNQGGLGITIELGQNGFDPYQISVGLQTALWAIQMATVCLEGGTLDQLVEQRTRGEPEIFTWAEIVPWPSQGIVSLDAGWKNFQWVHAGQRLGEVDGTPILAGHSGPILFPKYLSREQQANSTTQPAELVRIMRLVQKSELSTL